jgi:4-amino-4-deoxy-L-arabinose transferase-like glycosyltransferase
VTEDRRELRAGKIAFWLTLTLTAVRLVVVAFVGLGDAEAYYWTWSRHLDLSYYDHPPFIAYLIAATTGLGGNGPFFVRLGPVLFFAATAAVLYFLAVDVSGSRRAGLRALVLFHVTPIFAVGGQGANPDVPHGFFWVLCLWLLWRATVQDRRALAWPLGIALGLALLSKYFALFFGVAGLLWLLRREYRHWFRRPELYAVMAIAVLCFAPVLYWNAEHGWPSLRYHIDRHDAAAVTLRQAGMFLGGQALYYSPFLWGGFLAALVVALRRGFGRSARSDGEKRAFAFLATLSLPVLLFFTAVGFWTPESEPHWTAMGYLPLLIAAAMLFPEHWDAPPSRRRTWFRVYARVAVGLPALLLVLLHVHLLTPLLIPLVPERDRPRDLMSETTGWNAVGARALRVAGRMERPFLLHYHYTKCSQLSYAVRNRLPVACLNDRTDQFDFWQDESALAGRNALYVTDSAYQRRPDEVWRFDRCEEDAPLEIRRGEYLLRRFSFWRCYGYRGPAPGRRDL